MCSGGRAILWYLKELFRPLRPLLFPVWTLIQPFIEAPIIEAPTGPAHVVGHTIGGREPRRGEIRPLGDAEFELLTRQFPYYRQRSEYLATARRVAAELIGRYGLRSALELGPYVGSMIVGADIMDRRPNINLEFDRAAIIHDATRLPWPVADGEYDLFVALQVFEHLAGRQSEAFADVRRVARNAIISVPIGWRMDDPGNCHHQISVETALSWFAPTIPTQIVVGNRGSRTRLIFVFENLDGPSRRTGLQT